MGNTWPVQLWSSLITLSLSHTLGHLEFSWRTLELEKERQRRKEEARIKQLQHTSLQVSTCICIFLARFGMHGISCVFSLLDLACMGLHVFLFYHGMGFSRCDNILSLTLPFPDSFDKMGSLIRFMWDGQIGFKVEWGGSIN